MEHEDNGDPEPVDMEFVYLRRVEEVNYWTRRFGMPVAVVRAAVGTARTARRSAVDAWMKQRGFPPPE